MKIHRMHHWSHRHGDTWQSLIAAIGHAEMNFVADFCPNSGTWYLITKSPCTEVNSGRNLNYLVSCVELHIFNWRGFKGF